MSDQIPRHRWKLSAGLRRVLAAITHLQASSPDGVSAKAIADRLTLIGQPMARNNLYGTLKNLLLRRHIRVSLLAPRTPDGHTLHGKSDLYRST